MERAETESGLDAALGYVFRRPALRDQALTHKSYLNERARETGRDNERLELLGDAVLALVVTDYLVERFPDWDEGALSKRKSRLVSEPCLAQGAQRLGLGRYLRLGRGEELTQGREKHSLLADAFEALTAAIYLDGGLEASRAFVLRAMAKELADLEGADGPPEGGDYKTRLQEWCQRHFDALPQYRTVKESGPDHQKRFEVELLIDNRVQGVGSGSTKKAAEQAAAQEAWRRLGAAGTSLA